MIPWLHNICQSYQCVYINTASPVASLSLVRMGPNWLVLFGILSLTVAGGNSITLEEILEEIESLKYVVRELSARIEACDSQNKQQDITIEHNADSASTERDILTTRVHDNAIGLAENIQRAVDLRKDLSELQNGTQTGLNQLNETLTEELTKTQDKLTRTQDVLIPGVGAIIPWIPSKKWIKLVLEVDICEYLDLFKGRFHTFCCP